MSNTNQLILFTQSGVAEDLTKYMKQSDRKGADGLTVVGMSISLESRKVVAKELDVKQKSPKVTEALLKASDAIKQASLKEVVNLASSPEWTGGRVTVSRQKNGTVSKTFKFVTVDRTPGIKPEDIAKALSSMTEEQQIQIMEKAEAIKVERNATAIDAQKSELPEAEKE